MVMEAVNVTSVVGAIEPVGEAVIEMVGVTSGLTVTETGAEVPVHPLRSVAVTVNEPEAEIMIEDAVDPLLHR